jgi:hypothetical protein
MSDNPYHDHLDACDRCRNHPFALCTDGERILRAFVAGEPAKTPSKTSNGHAKGKRQ